MKKVTIRDVAKEAGVSVTLVSFVLNAKVGEDGQLDCPVNPNTAARVLYVAQKLGYKRNNAAASLRSGRSHTLAVIITDIASPFFAEMCRNIENIAYKAGYTVIFASSDESAPKFSQLIDAMIGYNVEGLIVAPCPGSEPILERMQFYNIPTVIVDRDVPGDYFGRVLVDNVHSGRQAAEYLINEGRKKVEMLSYSLDIQSLVDRVSGYENAMKAAGLEDNINVHKISSSSSNAEAEVLEIMKDAKARGVEGFIFPSKRMAILAFSAMHAVGMEYNKEVDLVCFDESDVYNLSEPAIPHIVQPLNEIALRSFDLFQKMLRGNVSPEEKNILLKTDFIK
ncbi:MAG: LacI family transcriptional regulator [Bacteroidales bacterium]|nr:LacI family transcriptional regulator [Bacteroidales bacterium]